MLLSKGVASSLRGACDRRKVTLLKGRLSLLSLAAFFFCLNACANAAPLAKNIILFIGDGMGPGQLGCLLNHKRLTNKGQTNIEKFLREGTSGLVLTSPLDGFVTDSAAAGTAIACGRKTLPGMIGVDCQGRKLESILQRAKKLGKSTGLISTIRVTDATPASFGAHIHSRYLQRKIANQLVELEIDVLLSGGARYFTPEGTNLKDTYPDLYIGDSYFLKSNRRDKRDLIAEAREKGYTTVLSGPSFRSNDYGHVDKLLGLFASDALPYRIDVINKKLDIPSLKEMTDQALKVLAKNKDGFFLMVEGAKIDWACHANDAATLLHEMEEFDQALASGLDFVKDRDDTMLIMMADHETGGFGFSYKKLKRKAATYPLVTQERYEEYLDHLNKKTVMQIERQTASFAEILQEAGDSKEKLVALVEKHLNIKLSPQAARRIMLTDEGTGRQKIDDFSDFYPYRRNVRPALLARALAHRTGVVWSTGTHTSTPIVIIAKGPKEEKFKGVLHHVDVAKNMFSLFE